MKATVAALMRPSSEHSVLDLWDEAKCSVRGSSFVVRRSWFVVRGSSFVVRRSWFVVRGSSFVVRRSWFVVRRSWFVVHP
jgi:hypothetical protein